MRPRGPRTRSTPPASPPVEEHCASAKFECSLPAPSIPEKLTSSRLFCTEISFIASHSIRYCGRLGLASDSPATMPTATAAPTTSAVLIENLRTRLCLAGAIAAPEGVEAGTPSGRVSGAAAVPNGVEVWSGSCEVWEGGTGTVWAAEGEESGNADAGAPASLSPAGFFAFWPLFWPAEDVCGAVSLGVEAIAPTGRTSMVIRHRERCRSSKRPQVIVSAPN